MEGGEGMVAVIHGLRDSGLAVTLLDGSRQYTLMPNPGEKTSQAPAQPRFRVMQDAASQPTAVNEAPSMRDSAAQATDERYASEYKIAHCKMSPTSPPVHSTEFPPQRAELCRGQGNFEVGGCGSGERYAPLRSNCSFRGSECSPRPSRERDAFADSLRKYPSMSTEMVERLITYTQAKNFNKTQNRQPSPSRQGIERNTTSPVSSEKSQYRNVLRCSTFKKVSEPDSSQDGKFWRQEESPTRDVTSRNVPVAMNSKHVATGPQTPRCNRNVAVPLSPTASCFNKDEGEVSIKIASLDVNVSNKSLQTIISRRDLSVQNTNVTVESIQEILNTVEKRTDASKRSIAEEIKCNAPVLDSATLEGFEKNTNVRKVSYNRHAASKTLDDGDKIKTNIAPSHDSQNDQNQTMNKINYSQLLSEIYNTETLTLDMFHAHKEKIKTAIAEWIKTLPIKVNQSFGIMTNKNLMIRLFTNRMVTVMARKLSSDEISLRNELLNVVSEIPMTVQDCHKPDFLNQVIGSLIVKVKSLINLPERNVSDYEIRNPINNQNIQPNYFIDCKPSCGIPSQNIIVGVVENGTNKNICSKKFNSVDHSIYNTLKNDSDANEDFYMNQLTEQINEWLSSQVGISQADNTQFRLLAIKDLAGDIVDRHKYLILNPSSRSSDEDELEHLKYQIFKWINKLVGENNMDTLERAPELMQRIQGIPVPVLTISHQYSKGTTSEDPVTNGITENNKVTRSTQDVGNKYSNLITPSSVLSNRNINSNNTGGNFTLCCSDRKQNIPSLSKRQINDDFDKFLLDWVKEIPTPTLGDCSSAETARQGIYNGIWKAITRLKFESVNLINPLLYEELLSNEIDVLLNGLKASSDFNTKREVMKKELTEEIKITNQKLFGSLAPAIYKQHLFENVLNNLPGKDINKMEYKKIDNFLIQKIVDNFILCAKYKENNADKADIYRKKLIKEIQVIIDNIKKLKRNEFNDIDTDMCINNILNALHKVPVPGDEVLTEEAKAIVIQHEIQQWITDLPLHKITNKMDENILKTHLTKRIIELEKAININDCSGDRAMRNDIILILKTLPLQNTEMEFLTEELINRIKNKLLEFEGDCNVRRKSVAFLDSVGYYEFSMQMPCCSSFSENPIRPALVNQSSYNIKDGDMVNNPAVYAPPQQTPVQIPSNEYFTLEYSEKAENLKSYNAPIKMSENSYYSIPHIPPKDNINPKGNSKTYRHSDPQIHRSNQGVSSGSINDKIKPDCMKIETYANTNENQASMPSQTSRGPMPALNNPRDSDNLTSDFSLSPLYAKCAGGKDLNPLKQDYFRTVSTQTYLEAANIAQSNRLTEACHHDVLNQEKDPYTKTVDNMNTDKNLLAPYTGHLTSYGQPQGFSTPRQSTTEGFPPKPDMKKKHQQQRFQKKLSRRRLVLESDSDEETEEDERCRCRERMMYLRREPYADEHFDMNVQTLVTRSCTNWGRDVALFGQFKEARSEDVPRHIKVHTSFSSTVLTPNKFYYLREIKSQINMRHNKNVHRKALHCFSEDNKELAIRVWKKMHRLAEKLSKPGEEEKLKNKIQRYLDGIPRSFTDNTIEQKEFVEQLPNSIGKKLKKIHSKSDKRRREFPIRILRIEIPTNENYLTENLKVVVHKWSKDMPIKKYDLSGRRVEKDDVINYIIKQLDCCIRNGILNFNTENTENLTEINCVIENILEDIPIEHNELDRLSILKKISVSLTDNLISSNVFNNLESQKCTDIDECISDFISNQLANILHNSNIVVNTKRLHLIKKDLRNVLLNHLKDDCNYENIKYEVYETLRNLVDIPKYQARYYTDIIIRQFYANFTKDKNCCKLNEKSTAGESNNYRSIITDNALPKAIDYKEIKHQLSEWFSELPWKKSQYIDKEVLDYAFNNLAKDVVDRIKYLKHYLNSNSTLDYDLEYLKYQIFKWLNELVGEDNLNIVEHAANLMERIKWISISKIPNMDCRSSFSRLITDSKCYDDSHITPYKVKIMQEAIMKWFLEYTNINDDFALMKYMAEDLCNTIIIENNINTQSCLDDVIEKSDINSWINKYFSGISKINVLAKLKQNLGKVIVEPDGFVDQKMEQIGKFAEIIDSWIGDYLPYIDVATLQYTARKELIRELATIFWDTINFKNVLSTHEIFNKMFKSITECLVNLNQYLVDDILVHIPDRDKIKLVKAILNYHNMKNQENLNQNGIPENTYLECWLKSLLLYKTANFADKIRYVDLIRNFKNKLSDCIVDPSQSILEFIQMLFAPIKDEEVILFYASNLKKYLMKHNLIRKIINNEVTSNNDFLLHHNLVNSQVAVYGFTLPSSSKRKENTKVVDDSITPITERDIQANIDLYSKELVNQIDEWLNDLQLTHIHDKGLRQIVINDLAGDIIDRHKYLELNQTDQSSKSNEVEQLRFQIFKWINKLVGDDNRETIQHASDLMQRIQKIPLPMIGLTNETKMSQKIDSNSESIKRSSIINDNKTHEIDNGAINKKTENVRLRDQPGPFGSRISVGPETIGLRIESNNLSSIPKGMTLTETYQYFGNVFESMLQQLPLNTATVEQAELVKLARSGMYNGIWKTYFVLKTAPEIENNYTTFELLFDERLKEMLDCLPQTNEMLKIRQGWKDELINSIMNMLKYEHAITDTPSFRDKIINRLSRSGVKDFYIRGDEIIQHDFVSRTADAFILYSKYKEEDPIKANIYRRRLMKRLDELSQAIKQEQLNFRTVNKAQLCQLAFEILETVPVPDKEVLKEEADEILMAAEIEDWYRALPVKPIKNEVDEILRKRLREILAKKLCAIEKQIAVLGEPSLSEQDMSLKHEISRYLEKDSLLGEDNNLNINYMVDELTNRIKIRRDQNFLNYDDFEKESPITSSFIETEPAEVLSPLVDTQPNLLNDSGNVHHVPNLTMENDPGQPIFSPRDAVKNLAYNNNHSQSSFTEGLSLTKDRNEPYQNQHCQTSKDHSIQTTENYNSYDNIFNAPKPKLNRYIPIIVTDASVQGTVENTPTYSENENGDTHQRIYNGLKEQLPRAPANSSATRSTARVGSLDMATQKLPSCEDLDSDENVDQYKCHCMKRGLWKRKRRHYCDHKSYIPCYPPWAFPRFFY